MCIVNPKTNAKAQIKKVGIISFHVLEQLSSPKGWVTHEAMITKPKMIAAVPKATWSHTIVDCKIGNPMMRVMLVLKTGIITEIIVARLSASAKMLRKPCIMRFLFLVLIL
jgi:hypothetical protein